MKVGTNGVGAVGGALESGRAVNAREDGVVATAAVRIKLGLLDHVVAGFAVDCGCEQFN